ncbi:MAG: glutamate--tRNA ligase [Candidatus Coatesbacteria bacterium]|nr:glutamate--tRNA ligase [Candidatus Coatesbacteria bacterium]
MEPARTRIAPSPTGDPHVGTAYQAIFDKAFAEKTGGQFILRIEDTDQVRSRPEYELKIINCLKWLKLDWDEGPDIGGPYAPYRQSERTEIYREHIKILLEKGFAYYCFCTADELEHLRQEQKIAKLPPGYFGEYSPCRKLTEDEVRSKIKAGIPYVIRLKVPIDEGEVSFFDSIRKKQLVKKFKEIDDQVLLKSDGFPTYHLANVVDDYLMKINTVIRGEEWIPSTFKHVLIYQGFGWKLPQFYHLALLRNPDSQKSKISKRKNPVSLEWFRAAGYSPEILVNYLALMAYSLPEGIERFSFSELVNSFNPDRLSAAGPAFDFVKLDSFNTEYLSHTDTVSFRKHLKERLDYLEEYLGEDLFKQMMERFKPLSQEVGYWTDFFFKTKLQYNREDIEGIKPLSITDVKTFSEILNKWLKEKGSLFENLPVIPEEIITEAGKENMNPGIFAVYKAINNIVNDTDFHGSLLKRNFPDTFKEKIPKTAFMILRISCTGSKTSLPLWESLHRLGYYRVIARLDEFIQFTSSLIRK